MTDLYVVLCGNKDSRKAVTTNGVGHITRELAPRVSFEQAERMAKLHDDDLRAFGHEGPLATIVSVLP